jgi:hypothetical protein
MPKIELTDEQAEELRDVVAGRLDFWECEWLRLCDTPTDPDCVEAAHRKSVLSDILHLLEIA